MSDSSDTHLALLVKTMEAFVSGDTPAFLFDDTYRSRFTDLPRGLGRDRFAFLETVFFACEDYLDDPDLRDPGDLDEQGLLEAARTALAALAGSW